MAALEYPGYESSEVNLREVIDLLRRRWLTLAVTFLLTLVAGFVLTRRMTPVYRSRATMLVEQSPMRTASARVVESSPIDEITQPTEPHSLETQVELLESPSLKRGAIERIGSFPPEAYPGLSVSQVSSTDLIAVVAESTDPQVARDAPNALITEYIEQTKANKLALIQKTRAFVEKKLNEANIQLATADARLRDFQERHRLADITSNRESAIRAANSIGEELRATQNDLSRVQKQVAQLSARIPQEPELLASGQTVTPNPQVSTLQAEINNAELRRISLLRTLKPNQPEVKDVDRQIAFLKARLRGLPRTIESGKTWQRNARRQALESQLDTLRVQERGLLAQVSRLDRQHQKAQAQLVAFPSWETTILQLQRDRDRMQESQRDFHNQLRHLRLREQAVGPPARLHTQASLPISPVRPRMNLNLMVAGALGLIFGVGAACLREMMDDRLYTSQQAEQLLGLPILGRVPTFPRRAPALIPVYRESTAKDSFRRLRAGLAIAGSAEPIHSLMITSATSGEGKSTTAANLAVAAALQGQRVILVDADLRNPSLSPFFGVSTEPGVGNVLLDGCPISDALHITDVPGLLLLPAGPPVQNAAELIAGPRMATLIQDLQKLADLVILDTPPCLPVADAEVLGTRVDAGLLVVGLGRTEKDAVRMAQELLDQSQVRLMGAVLNRMKPNDRGYYYRYGVREAAAAASLPAPVTALVRHSGTPVHSDRSGWEENET